ncbi:MAG: hypothetical protein JXA18_17155, partial [Chitinispirillaceae bacterium]|nr:hypothetical protein [Chitinispirillaceae bacterium]
NDISLNRGCSWFTVDGVWTIFDYQSWSRGPYTASGDMDIFRIPKYPPYAPQSAPAGGLVKELSPLWDEVSPASASSKVKVVIDTADLTFAADGSDIAIVYASILDNSSQVIPTATNSVTFSVSGPGTLVGTNPVAAVAGIASILLRAGTTGGQITVSASASGGGTGSASVTSHTATAVTWNIDQFAPSRSAVLPVMYAIHRIGGVLSVRIVCGGAHDAYSPTFTLCNAQGRVVGRWSLTAHSTTIDVTALSHGLYFGQVSGTAGRFIQKIVW